MGFMQNSVIKKTKRNTCWRANNSGALASTGTHSLAASPYAGQRSVVNCVLSLYYLAVLFYLANFNKKKFRKSVLRNY